VTLVTQFRCNPVVIGLHYGAVPDRLKQSVSSTDFAKGEGFAFDPSSPRCPPREPKTEMMKVDLSAIRRTHIFADTILVSVGWIGAYWLRYALNDTLDAPINSFDGYFRALPLIVVPWMVSCVVFGIYRSNRMSTLVEEFQMLFRGAALGLLVVASISFFFKELHFGRFVVLACAGFNFILQGVSRIAFHKIEERMRRSGDYDLPVLIAGTGVSAIRLLQKLQDHPEIGYHVVGFVDDSNEDDRKDVANRPVLGHIDDLREIAIAEDVREVFVAMPSLSHTRMLSIVLDCEDLGMTFRVVTNLFEVLTAGTPIDLVDDLPLVRLGRQRAHPLYEVSKRALDVVGASIALLLLGPVMLWCARRIVRESPGPAIFRQERVGRNGKTFPIQKFRTMHVDVERYEVAPKDSSDARITPFGRFLRVTSLDELPQLFNVLKGEMSLVGPRPEMPFIVDTYDEWQLRRLSVKPGITGLWQILGRKDLPMHENLQYDFYYIRNRSLGQDLAIMARTVGAVLSRRGAF
jgi:exopolysaccharide biosynthesis polyprenyl glycosylphosphotransferase